MSEEEDDYMSLKFLEEAEQFETKRQETYSERRKRQLREHEKNTQIKSRAQLEAEQLEKGLNQSVAQSENKGMKMLMKMGFKQGSGLGKDGIKEPIQVDLKKDRMGIGMKRAREQDEERELEHELKKRNEMDPQEYRNMMAQRAKDNQYIRYLTAAVSICEKMDAEKEITANILWICKPLKLEEGSDEGEIKALLDEAEKKEALYPETEVEELKKLSNAEKLDKVTGYLRTEHLYCFWCSAKYNDKEDLDTNCPGPTEDDH